MAERTAWRIYSGNRWYAAVGHASVEARDVDATIVTARYGAYDPLLRVAGSDRRAHPFVP